MPAAQARTLKVRPIQSCDLAFNVGGVLASHVVAAARLGGRLEPFDLHPLYARLGESDEQGRLRFDATAIRDYLQAAAPSVLFTVRAESLAAALEKGIRQRQIAFLQTYKHVAAIVAKYQALYPDRTDAGYPLSKLGRLETYSALTDTRREQIKLAHETIGTINPLTSAVSKIVASSNSTARAVNTSASTSTGTSRTGGEVDTEASGTETSVSDQTNNSGNQVSILPMGSRNFGATHNYREVPTKWQTSDATWIDAESPEVDLVSQKVTGSGSGHAMMEGTSRSTSRSTSTTEGVSSSTSTSTSNTDSDSVSTSASDSTQELTEYRHPYVDNDLRWARRHIELQDERLSQELFSLRIPHLDVLMANELELLDLDIRQLQLNYIHTFLVSSIKGIVTAIYKDVGESVQPGEPVLRIENDDEVYIVGRVNFRGRLRVDRAVTVTVANVFESGSDVTLSGTVASVRGHDADNDEWDIIFRCNNIDENDPSERKLPLNYTFDYRDVTIAVV